MSTTTRHPATLEFLEDVDLGSRRLRLPATLDRLRIDCQLAYGASTPGGAQSRLASAGGCSTVRT